MIIDKPDITLYHASYTCIEKVDFSYCRNVNDFGRGFYLTTDKNQAERFVRTSIIKSGNDLKFGYVNIYTLSNLDGLSAFEFPTTDEQWLHCVCAYRKPNLFVGGRDRWDSYDVLGGKIANDDTMTTLTIYLQSGYGEIGSDEAVNTAISVLKPQNLKDQICLRNEKAADRLIFKDAYEVSTW
jgi:hypothetical protein